MDDAAIAVQQKNIADAILALGGGVAAGTAALHLLRYIDKAHRPRQARRVQSCSPTRTTPAVRACLAGYQGEQHPYTVFTSMPCDSNCSEYQYYTSKRMDEEQSWLHLPAVDDKAHAPSKPRRSRWSSI